MAPKDPMAKGWYIEVAARDGPLQANGGGFREEEEAMREKGGEESRRNCFRNLDGERRTEKELLYPGVQGAHTQQRQGMWRARRALCRGKRRIETAKDRNVAK